jgi:NAD(P)-dependent dehydrogenase (short-subunit alcohol dehydrogenase family)
MNDNNKTSANKIQKVAIVTGSSSGIGRTTAIALAKEGIKVVIAARRDKEGEETLRLVKESGGDGIFVKTDVSYEDSVRTLVEKTVKTYGSRVFGIYPNRIEYHPLSYQQSAFLRL